jgi:hypothetical protein
MLKQNTFHKKIPLLRQRDFFIIGSMEVNLLLLPLV